jgi:tail collar domain
MKARTKLALAVSTVAALALGSFAWASIPDAGGTIHACYNKDSGALRVADRDTGTPKVCTSKETALDWAKGSPAADAYLARFGGNTGTALATQMPCTLGEVKLTAASRAAAGVPANGQILPIAQNVALFALLGTTYGGDGKTTFALPDLRPVTPNGMTYSICIYGDWPA